MKCKNLGAVIAQDSGENSIMQTISIAVSAILIAAGLITAPSLINNARDVNAKTDLASVAYSQEFFNSSEGVYHAVTTGTEMTELVAGPGSTAEGNVKMTLSAGTQLSVQLNTVGGYVAVIRSVSTNYFVRTGNSTTIRSLGKTVPTVATVNAALGTAATPLTIAPVLITAP